MEFLAAKPHKIQLLVIISYETLYNINKNKSNINGRIETKYDGIPGKRDGLRSYADDKTFGMPLIQSKKNKVKSDTMDPKQKYCLKIW